MTSTLWGRPTGTTTAHAPTLIDRTGRYRGPDLAGAVRNRRERLREHGVGPGERVMLHGENSAGYVVTLLALAQLDASVVLVDHCQSWAEVRAAAGRAGARWLLHPAGEGPPDPPTPGLAITSYPAEFAAGCASTGVAPSVADNLDAWSRRPDAVIMWSSGTSGAPKGVVKSGRAILYNTIDTQRVIGYRPDDVLAPWLPFSHQYGMSLLLLWWLTGATLLVTPYRRLNQAVDEAVRYRATVVDAPPSTYYTLLQIINRRPGLAARLAGVRLWGVGGAPLPVPLAATFRNRFGKPLLDGYGLTETGNVALATPDNPVGCGRPLPEVTVRVAGPDGAPVPVGVPDRKSVV